MTEPSRSLGLPPELLDYVIASSGGRDPIADELAAETRSRFGDLAGMNIEQDQARLMEFLVAWSGASTVVEVGTFTGMSALFLARGLGPDGRLFCFDVSDEYTSVGRPFWDRAGVADRISVTIGPAVESLAALPDKPYLDVVFLDADKHNYGRYLDLVVPRLSDRGIVLIDNTLWSGQVLDASDTSRDTEALRVLNRRLADDPAFDTVMLGVGDGLTLVRPRR